MAQAQNTKRPANKKASQRKKQKRKRRIRIMLMVAILIAAILACGAYMYMRFRTFDSYNTTSVLELTNNDDFSEYVSLGNGYLKITESGVTFFNKDGIVWSETYSMSQPLYDVCEDYAVVADTKQTEVYVFNKDGLVSRIPTQYLILDVEVSRIGVIAVATDDNTANYIEVYDKEGYELLTARSVFSSSGYLADIALASDGTKLAAAFINVNLQDIESRVVFYDFASTSSDDDVIVGGFNQYTDTVLTNVEFIDGKRVAAIGDNALSIYDFSDTPELIYENLEMEWTIQSAFFSDKYLGFITEDDTETNNYIYYVYNSSGEVIAEGGFDLSYTDVKFAGKNILINSSNVCQMYSFDGIRKFNCAFEKNIEAMYYAGGTSLIYATSSETNFIRMK